MNYGCSLLIVMYIGNSVVFKGRATENCKKVNIDNL